MTSTISSSTPISISPGVTMGVAPIRLLAEEGGVLDGLVARGFDVVGPEWK